MRPAARRQVVPVPGARVLSGTRRRTAARWAFHGHLWLGILATTAVALVSITGVVLNHKRVLGIMPDVRQEADGSLSGSLPLDELRRMAEAAVEPAIAEAGVDRMDVRPSDGLVKVRFDDTRTTEVTLDLRSGAVLLVGERGDVFMEKLHSGEIFGDNWVLLSDFAAVSLLLLLATGYWLWLYPRTRL